MDLNRLTQKSQEALHDAQTKALRFGHTEVDGEHLLLALLDQGEGLVGPLLARAGADPDRVREDLEAELRRRPRVSGPGAAPGQVFVTQRLSRLIEAATREAHRLKDEYVSVEHLVVALLDEGSSSAAGRLLQQQGLTRNGFLSALTEIRGHQRVTSATPEGTYEALGKYGRDLVAEAAAGRLEPVIGRDSENCSGVGDALTRRPTGAATRAPGSATTRPEIEAPEPNTSERPSRSRSCTSTS